MNKKLYFPNEYFYNADGSFNKEKALDAIEVMLRYHGYPLYKGWRKNTYVFDGGAGHFAEMGLAFSMVANEVKDGYMLQELFLLPGQMLPEHMHHAVGDVKAKCEGWMVRYGKSYIAGIGKDNMNNYPEIKIPKCHCKGKVKEKHIIPTEAGKFTKLAKVESLHWQMGGPEGAIMSEVATPHLGEAIFHTDTVVQAAHEAGLKK